MAIDFDKWDKQFSVSAESVNELKKNETTYEEIPFDKYYVSVAKMELTSSKKGDPMLSVRFRILEGKYKNQLIFMNSIVTNGYGIHNANEFMRSLDSGVDIKWTGSYGAYADMIDKVFEAVEKNLEYALDYSSNSKGYSVFKIEEVFDKE